MVIGHLKKCAFVRFKKTDFYKKLTKQKTVNMKPEDLIKCETCGEAFDPADLSVVIIHEHKENSAEMAAHAIGIKGVQTGKTFTPEQSSNVREIGYDAKSMTMTVTFRNAQAYQYFDVPQDIWQQALEAQSIGSFMAKVIKGNYRYSKV